MASNKLAPQHRHRPLHADGLYDPANEHDACGVGLICNLSNRKEHELVKDALKIL